MHRRKNDHRHLWVLSGTGEGPCLTRALIDQGWRVSVSVVSFQGSLPYLDFPLEALWVGPIAGVEGIKEILNNSISRKKTFDFVIDATHPFAEVISSDLQIACGELSQPLIRFEREIENVFGAKILSDLTDLSNNNFEDKNVLLAIGFRQLSEAVKLLHMQGAIVFARVLPSSDSYRKALNALLPAKNVAVVRPFEYDSSGEIESALCRHWSIDAVVCRQSGGVTEKSWQLVCRENDIDLFLIARPEPCKGVDTVNTYIDLFNKIMDFN